MTFLDMNNFKDVRKTMLFVMVCIVTFSSFYVAAAAIGMNIPRPAWIAELREVAEDTYQDQILRIRRELLDIESFIIKVHKMKGDVPEHIIRRKLFLEEDLLQKRAKLKKMRS